MTGGGGVTDAKRLAEVRRLAALREKYPKWRSSESPEASALSSITWKAP